MQRALPLILLSVLLPAHLLTLSIVTGERRMLPRGEGKAYVLPSPILKITTLEFDGLASDFMFLQALVFHGGTFERKERPRVKEWEWRWMLNTLNASTDLDPYFLDPYYFGNANLTWEGGLVKETNAFLEKGMTHRDWDWMLPFFIGFNHFYFLQEDAKASEYLMEAFRRPGASPMLASLATRLAYKGKRTENAIIFLEEILKRTEDEVLRRHYEKRLEALKAILFLERAVGIYKDRFGREPSDLKGLIERGIINQLPEEPYGGEFYIDKDGSINTTSRLMDQEGSAQARSSR